MVTVDDREGSAQLFPLLAKRGIPVTLGRLAFGDISFIGTGIDDEPVPVGIEVKSVRDVLKCMTDGRFAGHQLPGMINCYQQIWLLVEGTWRPRPRDGILEVQSERHGYWFEATIGQRRFMWKDLQTWLLTVQTRGGVRLVTCSDYTEASLWISTLYNWWMKGIENHESHLAIHTDNPAQFRDRALLIRPTICRMVAKELPGVGFDKSAHIAKFFGTVENLVAASEWDLAQVPGIGKELARRIHAAIRSER